MKLSVHHRICMVHCEENGESGEYYMNAYKELIFWQMSRSSHRGRKVAVRIAGYDSDLDSSRDYDQKKQFNYEERKAEQRLKKYRGF